MAADVTLKALPPKEAIAFFRQKGYRTTFAYQDMFHRAHSDSFTVAGVSKLDVLQDLRTAMDDAVAKGTTFADFKKTVKPKLAAKGWWGPVDVTDPITGEMKTVDLSTSRRLRTIFDTNLRTSYSAGHWARIQRTKASLPYLRYANVRDGRSRPLHQKWGDPKNPVILPVDHPWWNTHFPPCGWGCRCWVIQMTKGQVERAGLRVWPEAPDDGPDRTYTSPRTGETFSVPPGIDPSFAYNPGQQASFPDPAKYSDAALAKEAARRSVASDAFADLVAQKTVGAAPVAWIDDTLSSWLRTDVSRVDLSSDTIAKQADRHPEIGLNEYRELPGLLQEGLVVDDGSGGEAVQVFGMLGDGNPYTAVVKRTASGQALVSFYRVRQGQLLAALAVTPIRDSTSLRAFLTGLDGPVG